MKNRRLLIAGWVLVLLAVLCMRPWKGVEDAGEGERQVFYALEPGGEVSFRVSAGESRMRVLARLETDTPASLDESRTWRFGVGLDLEGGGQTHSRAHWTRSRLTLLEDGTPAAVTPTADKIVTDTRIVDLELAPHMAQGGLLRVRAVDLEPGERLLIRSFRETSRSRAELAGGATASVLERLARTYPLPWPELSAQERLWFSASKRLTIPAEEIRGAQTIALTRYAQPSSAPMAETWGYKLNPGESTALNIRGPAVLRVWAAGERDKANPSASNLPIELVDASPVPVEGGSLGPNRVVVPEGAVWSLHWHHGWEEQPVYLSFELDPAQAHSWGEPPGAGGAQPLAPERRRLTYWRVDQQLSPVQVPVAASKRWGVLRVEARPLADSEWKRHPTEGRLGQAVTLRWQALDAQGEVLEHGAWEVPFQHAPYERFVEQEKEPVSEVTARFLHHRRDAAVVVFSSDGPLDLRFLVPLAVQPERAPEYDLGAQWRGRYAPWEMAPYLSIAPLEAERLTLEERLIRMDATVRIEPKAEPGDGGALSELHTWALRPMGGRAEHPILEPVRRAGPFKPHHRTRLGATTRLEVPESAQVQVDYRVAKEHVGESLTLQCGELSQTQRLYSAGGVLTFNGLPTGTQRCTLHAPEGFFLADVPGGGARWARRNIYRADQGTLRVRAQVQDPLEVLYARAYTGPGRPAPVITLRIDGGEIQRQALPTERRTAEERSYVPPEPRATARLINGGSLQAWSGMPVVLGDDLARGTHLLEFQATAPDGGPVYMRFDASWMQGQAQEAQHWVSKESP